MGAVRFESGTMCLVYIHAVYIRYWLGYALNPDTTHFSLCLSFGGLSTLLIFQFSPRLVMNMSRQIINI